MDKTLLKIEKNEYFKGFYFIGDVCLKGFFISALVTACPEWGKLIECYFKDFENDYEPVFSFVNEIPLKIYTLIG